MKRIYIYPSKEIRLTTANSFFKVQIFNEMTAKEAIDAFDAITKYLKLAAKKDSGLPDLTLSISEF